MTCTHAALKRKDLVKMGFKYDNIIMEEAAQILEIETFIPLLLQTPQDGHNRLKRYVSSSFQQQMALVLQSFQFQTKYTKTRLSEVNFQPRFFSQFLSLNLFIITFSSIKPKIFSQNCKISLKTIDMRKLYVVSKETVMSSVLSKRLKLLKSVF